MSKKAQVSIFMILGVVLLLVVGLLFFIVSKSQIENVRSEQKEITTESVGVASFVTSCLQSTLTDGIRYTAAHGGYYYPGLYYTADGEGIVPLFYDAAKDGLAAPSKEKMEEQLAEYINSWIGFCVSNTSLFPGAEFTLTNLTEVSFSDETVRAWLVDPVEIRKEGIIKKTTVSPVETPYPAQKIVGFLSDYNTLQKEAPHSVPLTRLIESSILHELELNLSFGKNEVVYYFKDPTFKIRNEPVQFKFAAAYQWNVTAEPVTHLEEIIIVTQPGKEVTYLLPEGYELVRDSEYVINGVFSFTPTEEDVGENNFMVELKNETAFKTLFIDVNVEEIVVE